jgi:hypothetical protein
VSLEIGVYVRRQMVLDEICQQTDDIRAATFGH